MGTCTTPINLSSWCFILFIAFILVQHQEVQVSPSTSEENNQRVLLQSLHLAVSPIKGLCLQLWLSTAAGFFLFLPFFCLCPFLLSRAKWFPLCLVEVLCNAEEQHSEVSPNIAFIHAVLLLTKGSCVHRTHFYFPFATSASPSCLVFPFTPQIPSVRLLFSSLS